MWIVELDGIDDSLTMSGFTATGDFKLSGFFNATSLGTRVMMGSSLNTSNFIAIQGGVFDVRIGGSSLTTAISISAGVGYSWDIERVGTTVTIDVNGTQETKTTSSTAYFDLIGAVSSGSFRFQGQIGDTTVMNGDSGGNRLLNFNTSSHGAGTVTITDTISGQNATGVNMPTDGSAWVNLGGGGISLTVTEVLNSFTDISNINIDYNVSAVITETLNSFGDTSVISVTSGQVVNLTVTETLSVFTDVSNINVSANIELLVTEVLNSFLDGANVTIAKDITLQVTEVFNSFADNSSIRLPANWVDKTKVTTTYTTQTPASTTWIDKG